MDQTDTPPGQPGAGGRRARLRRWSLAGALALAPTFSYTAHAVIRNIQSNWGRLLMVAYVLALLTPAVYWLLFRFALPRLRHWPASRRLTALGGALLAGALLAALLPRPQLLRLHRLELTALGQRNPAAQASQVWVIGLRRPDGSAVPLADLQPSGDWRLQDGKLAALGSQPATLRWEGGLAGDPTLLLLTHRWSGLAEVRWDDQAQTVDLFSPAEGTRTLGPPPGPRPGSWREALLGALTRATDVASAALLVLVTGLWIAPRSVRRDGVA